MKDFIDRLSQQLQKPLPGRPAQYSLAHAGRQDNMAVPPDAKLAGVLVLFFPKAGEWHLVLIERTSRYPNDRHSGQISFPGGRHETSDQTLLETALREAAEEVGIIPQQVNILGALSDLYIPVSNFHVHPHVGFTTDVPLFIPQPAEVQSILEVPFNVFQAANALQHKDIRIYNGMTLKAVPHFNVFGKTVWGATAMMLGELLEIVKNGS
ncbi:MAG: CoA pyrophosphatase [Saprospiraceae bacterium]